MLEIIKYCGFLFLLLRFLFWISASFFIQDTHWQRVLFAQFCEGMLLLFFFIQLFAGIVYVPFSQTPFTVLSGFFCILIGVAGAFEAKRELKEAWIYASSYTIIPHQHLQTTGIYTYIRHPLYTSILISFIGAEIMAGSFLWISFLFFLIPMYFQAKKEEESLQNHFGKAYTTYKAHTKMLIPLLL